MASGTTEPSAVKATERRRTPWEKRAYNDKTRFINDVLVRPSVGATMAWLISLLVGLVVWLTLTYAPGAIDRASEVHGANRDEVIPVTTGYMTIAAVSILALIAGWEPAFMRWFKSGRSISFRPWLSRWPLWLGIPIFLIIWMVGWTLWIIWRTPSFVLSLIDWLMVRVVAIAAGTTLRPFYVRYAALFAWLGAIIYLAWAGPYGILATAVGVVIIFSVVRRWGWIERDREAILAMHRSDPEIERVGFGEDLRDEALTAILFIFILTPLALRQVNMAYDAFYLVDDRLTAIAGTPTVLDWIGFFGAELAKSVPLVDWSEVFYVANGSPIRAQTPLGAQLVFVLRASLDLLLLAAILQAVKIAARLRDQTEAFLAHRLPILDPFAERSYFRAVANTLVTHPHVPAAKQPAATDFPVYNEERLYEIVKGQQADAQTNDRQRKTISPVLRDDVARQGAMTILACHYPGDKTARLLAAQVIKSASTDWDSFCLGLAIESAPDRASAIFSPLLAQVEAPAVRAQIARELGRLKAETAFDALRERLLANDEDMTVRAAAAVALSKLLRTRQAPSDIIGQIDELIARLQSQTALDVVMMLAYARAAPDWLTKQRNAQSIITGFPENLRPLVWRAIHSRQGELDKMVEIPSGNCQMGDHLQRNVEIASFEMGKYTVTFEEYDTFCDATGREKPLDRDWGRGRRPAIYVSWRDAHAYCDWLYEFTGERFRLPSEAEWEYACRAGTTTPYGTGETISKSQAQFSEDGLVSARNTAKVGTFQPNGFDLHDMHGNVWEWCADPWHETYHSAPRDGSVWLKDGSLGLRVLRGGSWNDNAQFLRSASRLWGSSGLRNDSIGFRLARNLQSGF